MIQFGQQVLDADGRMLDGYAVSGTCVSASAVAHEVTDEAGDVVAVLIANVGGEAK